MSEGMTTRRLRDSRFESRLFDSPLQYGFVKVVPSLLSSYPVCVMAGFRVNLLPLNRFRKGLEIWALPVLDETVPKTTAFGDTEIRSSYRVIV